MKVTLGEILTSLVLIAILTGLGIIIENKINSREEPIRVTIDTAGEFDYAIRTGVGPFIAEDTLKAIDPVTIPDLPGEYMMIKKIKEVYTEHTRTVSYEDEDGEEQERTETYWEWEVRGEEKFRTRELRFLGFPVNIEIPAPRYKETKRNGPELRYRYETTPSQIPGTLCGDIPEKGTLTGLHFWREQKIEDIERKGNPVTVFWILWVILMFGVVILYYSGDNEWLEY